ncbi:hypothetical protein [Streptomyces sp. MJM1172]|uniref:hypothetical protein n=1 Tax=Streptomyces sp. MJM1172 TaxID=1703926 RepID=UPI00093997DB|nr:hypothetical protein [Streptomyces sp. MJM1172]OKI50916.1 hypothetical protein AMK15_31480 [Streptomyces sp. MJM1172]
MPLIRGHDAPAYGLPLCGNEKTVTASPVCEECFDAAEGAPAGVVGLPETLEAPRPVGGEVETTALPSDAGHRRGTDSRRSAAG